MTKLKAKRIVSINSPINSTLNKISFLNWPNKTDEKLITAATQANV